MTTSVYANRYAGGHPLETPRSRGVVGEHRLILFDAIGPGVHPCHWCADPVAWHPQPGESLLVVDHVDEDTTNNDPENLVPSCRRCNQRRPRAWWQTQREPALA
jgi:hypothetical protein